MGDLNRLPTGALERIIASTRTVYSLPIFYERLSEVVNHPRSSVADITRVISEDQGLTARLLKLANSPLFGYFSKIDSITKAVTIIGTQQMQALALAVSVMEIFNGIPENLINMKSFWKHSIACGIIAKTLATYRREANVERVFAAGLLHDVGRVVMCTAIPEMVTELITASSKEAVLLYELEEARLGYTHAAVGGGLLAKWRIPVSITEPVACHHDPAAAERFPLEAALIHFADLIAHALALGFSGDWYVPPLDTVAWKSLDIPEAALATIVKQVEPQLTETLAILGESAP